MYIVNGKEGLMVNTYQCKQIRVLDKKWIDADDITIFKSDDPEEVEFIFRKIIEDIRNNGYIDYIDTLRNEYLYLITKKRNF